MKLQRKDNLNGRQLQWKTTSTEDNRKGKTVSLERQIQWEDRPQRETVFEGKITHKRNYYVLHKIDINERIFRITPLRCDDHLHAMPLQFEKDSIFSVTQHDCLIA